MLTMIVKSKDCLHSMEAHIGDLHLLYQQALQATREAKIFGLFICSAFFLFFFIYPHKSFNTCPHKNCTDLNTSAAENETDY